MFTCCFVDRHKIEHYMYIYFHQLGNYMLCCMIFFQMTDKDRSEMQILMPLLDTVSSVHSDPSVQEMASDLRIAIATHGVVLSDKLQQKV